MAKGNIRFIGAPPASGKSAVKVALAEELGSDWLVLEHEQIFTPEQRVKTAELAGVEMSSREFVLGANLPGQMAFQALLRSIADTGLNVVGLGPFENVFSEVGGVPLWRKMTEEDFLGYDLGLIYFLVTPKKSDWWISGKEGAELCSLTPEEDYVLQVEDEIQARLLGRANKSPYQQRLDGDKVGVPDYYRRRASMVCRSAETFGFPLLSYALDMPATELAQRLADAVRG